MMPRVDKSPSGERENRSHKEEAEDSRAEKDRCDEEDERAEKHQAPAQPMGRPPSLGIFECPRGTNTDEVIWLQIAKIISHDDEEG